MREGELALEVGPDDSLFSKISKLVPGEFIVVYEAAVGLSGKLSYGQAEWIVAMWLVIAILGGILIYQRSELKSSIHVAIYFFCFFVVSANLHFSQFSNVLSDVLGYVINENLARFYVVEPTIVYVGPILTGMLLLFVPKEWLAAGDDSNEDRPPAGGAVA